MPTGSGRVEAAEAVDRIGAAWWIVGIAVLLMPAIVHGDPVVRLSEGWFVLDDSSRPPPDTAPWEPITLPDEWSDSRPGRSGVGWYRFELPASGTGRRLEAVYLPAFNMNAEVWLDDRMLARCGPFDEPDVAHCWNHPLYVPLPGGGVEAGSVLHVRLFTYVAYGGLGAIFVGPGEVLRPRYERDHFLRAGVARFFTGMAVIVVGFMGVFWIGSRESVYGWFALLTIFWAGAMLNNHVRDIPVPHDWWEWLVHSCFDWMGVAAFFTVRRVFEVRSPRVDRAVLAWGCFASVAAFVTPRPYFHVVANGLHGVSLIVAASSWSVLFRRSPRPNAVQVTAFCITMIVVVLGVHDFLLQAGFFGIDEPHLFSFAAPVTTLSFALLLMVRFVQTFNRARRLNVELEDRVRAKHRELEANFERLRELERAQAVARERERIMREVHDGMGGQLVSTLALVQTRPETPEEVAEALRSCIDDMRLVIDSLDPNVDDLPTLLGMIRGRLEPRLRRYGLRFEWRASDLPPVPWLGPHEFLQILRIFQEAVTNVVKHADARVITVTSGVRPFDGQGEGVFLELRDDGRGLRDARTEGRGLRNMQHRARELGASLRIEAAQPGTRVLLWLPFERHSAAIEAREERAPLD